jgi:PleD family two-component response regulator
MHSGRKDSGLVLQARHSAARTGVSLLQPVSGVASLSETESADAKELAGKADEALYKAKKTGRKQDMLF